MSVRCDDKVAYLTCGFCFGRDFVILYDFGEIISVESFVLEAFVFGKFCFENDNIVFDGGIERVRSFLCFLCFPSPINVYFE